MSATDLIPTLMPVATGEMASIIILCCNEVSYTRLCLESVLRHTAGPYELIFVDNGSTDETPVYLEEVRASADKHPGLARVVVLRNETNRGFPAGVNQGLAVAQGRFLVLLNNDTIVSAGWLNGMIAWARHDAPSVGLVGVTSNYTVSPQRVEVDYADLKGLEAFAARRRLEQFGRCQLVQRLTGFCLLIRREVIERLGGGLDERFGLGFFDDDDLSMRARQAGFRLLLAHDVFIHHFGSRTFAGLGIDCNAQLQSNFELFQAKWGAEKTAGYRAPGAPAKTAAAVEPIAAAKKRVSLTMIVRNEEANLQACLESVGDLVDEVIVVDTGSTDRTKEIAANCGARVFEFPWCDDFAAARNESLRHATGDWILWLDADDRLDADNRERLRGLFTALGDENTAYVVKVRSGLDKARTSTRLLDQVRLFRNRPEIRWRYRVHEQILPAINKLGGTTRWTDVVVDHTGYQDPSFRQRKLERNLGILCLEAAEQPEDPFTLFNLGRTYLDLGRTAEAVQILHRSLERSGSGLSIVRKLYALLAQGHRQLGHRKEALAICREGLQRCTDDAELLFQQSLLLREEGDLAGAASRLERLLESHQGAYFDMVDAGLRGYKTRHQLAALYYEQQRQADAEAQWRAVLEERPRYRPALLGLGDLYLSQQRWADAEHVAGELETGQANVDAAVLRARGFQLREEYRTARWILEEAITQSPRVLRLRVLLTHALIKEGQDWTAAEKALRGVLQLDPNHGEARHNLRVLLRQRKRATAA